VQPDNSAATKLRPVNAASLLLVMPQRNHGPWRNAMWSRRDAYGVCADNVLKEMFEANGIKVVDSA
jgi:hypothetical protein